MSEIWQSGNISQLVYLCESGISLLHKQIKEETLEMKRLNLKWWKLIYKTMLAIEYLKSQFSLLSKDNKRLF